MLPQLFPNVQGSALHRGAHLHVPSQADGSQGASGDDESLLSSVLSDAASESHVGRRDAERRQKSDGDFKAHEPADPSERDIEVATVQRLAQVTVLTVRCT